MPLSTLPPELIEAIIDEVGSSNDILTLRACSLVSPNFTFRSQSYLFRTIDLDRQLPRKKHYWRFHLLLVSKPRLGTYVRQLRLGDDAEDEFGHGGRGRGESSWIIHTQTIAQTLELLPLLEGFSLTFNSEMTNWKALPAITSSAFERLFRLPSLQAVSLEFIGCFPRQLLLSLMRMRYLGLSCVEMDTSSPLPSQITHFQHPHLQSLFLRGTSMPTIQAISQALSTSSPPTLRKLSITPAFEAGFCEAVHHLIQRAGHNIAEFEWLPSVHFSSPIQPISIDNLPHLRFLRCIVTFRRTQHGPLSEVLRLLGQMSARPNQIETIVLDCHCPPRGTKAEKELKTVFRPLDKVLSEPAFRLLKELKVELSTSTSVEVDRKKFVLAFQDLLPGLEKKGTLISVRRRLRADERFLIEGFGE